MTAHEFGRDPLTPQERWFAALFLLLLLGLFAAEVVLNYEPAKLSALLFVLFWIPLLALHEAAHAVVAWLLGWRVGQIVIGMGRTFATFRLGEATMELRVLPVEGFVGTVPGNLRLARLKSALIYFAGPGVELLLAAVLLLAVGPERLLSRTDDYGIIACQSLALAAVAGGVVNLIPHAVWTPAGPLANDGLGIIRSFLVPMSHYADMVGQTYNPDRREWETDDPADWWKK